jgi:hypothetical protein
VIRNNLGRKKGADDINAFAPHKRGEFRKVKSKGSDYFLVLGEKTTEPYKGRHSATGGCFLVQAFRVDINGIRIDEEALLVPDGFLSSNVHRLPTDIAGKGWCMICRNAFSHAWCVVCCRRAGKVG